MSNITKDLTPKSGSIPNIIVLRHTELAGVDGGDSGIPNTHHRRKINTIDIGAEYVSLANDVFTLAGGHFYTFDIVVCGYRVDGFRAFLREENSTAIQWSTSAHSENASGEMAYANIHTALQISDDTSYEVSWNFKTQHASGVGKASLVHEEVYLNCFIQQFKV